jgi:membrane protein
MPESPNRWKRFGNLYQKEIWQPAYLKDSSPRGYLYAALRVFSIVLTVFKETKAASRAAALSFSSLLGLGPMVAIAVLVAGFVIDQNDPNLAVNTLNKLITYVAPQIVQYQKLSADGKAPPAPQAHNDIVTAATMNMPAAARPAVEPPAPTAPAPGAPAKPNTPVVQGAAPNQVPVNAELVNYLNGFISGSRSSTAGVVGALTLILIVLQLFTSIENSFNEIWGVRRGRTWLMRIVFYWTVLTLGSMLFFAALTMISASAYMNVFEQKMPFGSELVAVLQWMLPSFSVMLLIVILTLFYRCIPNTHVHWRSALVGAVVVAALIVLNNFLAFIYFRRVLLTKSLYGSLGILPILMLGLFIFWLFVLIGGQISYAVQNVHYRNSQAAWGSLTESARERLSLVVLLTICRRFQACLPAITASNLGSLIKVPTQVLNECLNRLVDLKLITPLPPAPGADATDYFYQPARPLNRITLFEFKRLFENYGDDPAGDTIEQLDPLVKLYRERLDARTGNDFFTKTVDQLFGEMPFDESRPPFATMSAKS